MYLTDGTIQLNSNTSPIEAKHIYETLEAGIEAVSGDDYSYHELPNVIVLSCVFVKDNSVVNVLKGLKPFMDKIEKVNIKQWGSEYFGNYLKVEVKDGDFVVYEGRIVFEDKPSTTYTFDSECDYMTKHHCVICEDCFEEENYVYK